MGQGSEGAVWWLCLRPRICPWKAGPNEHKLLERTYWYRIGPYPSFFIALLCFVRLGLRCRTDGVSALSRIRFGLSWRHIGSDFLRDLTFLEVEHMGWRWAEQCEIKNRSPR